MCTATAPPFSQPVSSQKPNWTAGKIIAMILIVIVASAGGVGAYLVTRPASPTSSVCANGATNPPSCTTFPCSNGATNPPSCDHYGPCSNGANNPPKCDTFTPCSNGANNPPDCNTYNPCPNGGTNPPMCNLYPGCSNGANNPPSCDYYPDCYNGAVNEPACNFWNSTITVICNPSTITNHNITTTTCTVYVSARAPTTAAGKIDLSATFTPWYNTNTDCASLKMYSATEAYCTVNGISTTSNPGIWRFIASYAGDSTHSSGAGNFNLTVVNPTATMTASYASALVQPGSTLQIQTLADAASRVQNSPIL